MASPPLDRARLGVITAATIGTMVGMTSAVHSVFGTFLIPLSQAFGWPRASISVVLGIVSLVGALIYPLAGRYTDRHGTRRLLLIGNAGLAGAIALLALSNGSLTRFYLTFALIGILGALTGSAIYSKVVSDWFDDNRGTMLGISAGIGNGAGSTMMPILAAVLLTGFGWRSAYVGIALIVLLVGFPVLFLGLRDTPRYHRDDPAAPLVAGMTLAQAVRTPAFWLLLVSIASGAGCLTAVFSHTVPILAERGFGLGIGTSVLGTFALVCAGWQIVVGNLLDRTATARIVAPMYLLAVAGLVLIETGTGTAALLAGGVLLGIGLGAQYGALPFLVARYFGLRSFGTIIGAMYSAVVMLQGVTPVLLDHAFDVQGTYRIALEVIGLCLAAGAALLLALPPYRMDAGATPKPATAPA